MKMYIIRHGQTPWNARKCLQGRSDVDLNENGIYLAELTGKALRDVTFDMAFTSPLIRAKHTAQCILAGREVPIIEDERLTRSALESMRAAVMQKKTGRCRSSGLKTSSMPRRIMWQHRAGKVWMMWKSVPGILWKISAVEKNFKIRRSSCRRMAVHFADCSTA